MLRILMVPVIMGCALVGTVGMIKAIKKFSPEQFDKHKTTNRNEDEIK